MFLRISILALFAVFAGAALINLNFEVTVENVRALFIKKKMIYSNLVQFLISLFTLFHESNNLDCDSELD